MQKYLNFAQLVSSILATLSADHDTTSGFLELWTSGIPGFSRFFQAISNRIPGDFCATLSCKKEMQDLLHLKKIKDLKRLV